MSHRFMFALIAALALATALPSAAMAEDVPWVYDTSGFVPDVISSATGVASNGIATFGAECADSNGLGRFRSISGATRIIVR